MTWERGGGGDGGRGKNEKKEKKSAATQPIGEKRTRKRQKG